MSIELDDLFGTYPVNYKEIHSSCPAPGVYHSIPSSEYHKWAAISSSLLKAYAALPSTARTPFIAGDDANVGSGIHALSLQGQTGLDTECFILSSDCEGKSAKAMQIRAAEMDRNPGKVALPPTYGPMKIPVMDVLEGVDDSLNLHPKIGPIIRESQKEVSLVWIDEASGCTCKARLDIWDGQIIWDLKKCRSINSFQWQIKDLFYGIQAGHYFNGAMACGLNPVAFGFVPCEAFPPYQVACGYVDPEKLEMERENARRIIGLVKQSQVSDIWPNYPIPAHVYDLGDITPDDLVQLY
jgi:hypothetical protein